MRRRRWMLPAGLCALAGIVLVFQLGGFDRLVREPSSGALVAFRSPASVGDSVAPVPLQFVAWDSLEAPSSQHTALLSELANDRCAVFLLVDPACPACLEVAPAWSADAPAMDFVGAIPVFLVALAGEDESIREFRATFRMAFPALKTSEPNQASSMGVLGVPTVWIVSNRDNSRDLRRARAGQAEPA